MPTTLGLCFLANSTASPMWSPCPCVHNMTSILSKVFLLDGVEGLFMTQGSTRICLPPGVSNRKVACPSQVTLIPLNLIRSHFRKEPKFYSVRLGMTNALESGDRRDRAGSPGSEENSVWIVRPGAPIDVKVRRFEKDVPLAE